MNQPHHAHRHHHNNHHQQQHHHPMHQQARMPTPPSMQPQQQWIGPHPPSAQNSQQQQHHPQQSGQHHPHPQQQPPPPPMPAQQQPHQQQAAQHHQQPHQQAAQHHQQSSQQQQHHHPNQPQQQQQQHHHPMHTQAQMPMPPNMPPQQQWIGPHPPPAQNSQAQQQHHHHPQQPVQHHPPPSQQQQHQAPPPPPPHHLTHPQAGTMMINQQTYPQNFLYHQMGPPFVGPPGHLNQYEHPSAASHQSGPVNVNSQQQQVSINNHHPGNVTLPQLQSVISTPTTTNVHHPNNGSLMEHMSNRMQLNQQPYMLQHPYSHLPPPYYPMIPHPIGMGAYPPGGPQIPPPNPAMIPPVRGPGDLGVQPRFDPTRNPTTPLTANLSQPPSAKPPLTAPPLANMQPPLITPVVPAKPREKMKARIVDPKTKHVFTLDELTDSPKTENNASSKDSTIPARISTKDQSISDKESSSNEEVKATDKGAGDSSVSEMVTEESRKSPDSTRLRPKPTEPFEERKEYPIQEVKVEITDVEELENEEDTETEPVVVKICENESNKVEEEDELAAELANMDILKNDKPSDQITTDGSSTETPVKKQTLPNLPYEANQYSPLNPEGRKKYGIKFLRAVAQEMKIDILSSSAPNQRIDAFMPHYVNHNERGNYRNDFSSQPLTRRSSQQIINKPRKIIATHSLQQEVELNTAEKPWKFELEEEKIKVIETGEIDTKRLLKVFRGHLNKLTPQKYDSLIEKIIALDLIGPERLSSVIDLVFDKAVDEPGFCELYAKMCREIATKDDEFSKHLIRKCQEEFETFDLYDGLNVDKRKIDIETETDAIKKKIMSEELYEDMRLRRKKYLGTIKLIGEMYKFDLLSSKIIGLCMNHLIKETSNENIECLCSLLATVGPKMNSETSIVRESLKSTLYILNNIANSKKASELALENRIKFKILDTMDLSRRNWMPRTGENNPRMITEIREEERQRQQNHSSQPKNMLKSDDRDRIRGDRRPNHAYNAPLSRGKPW